MREPVWIDIEDVLAFHGELLAMFGGMDGLRDRGLLESALNRPKNSFYYQSTDLFQLASEYALGVVKNHPFLDGNKRSGFLAAALFLEINGYQFTAPEEEVVVQTRALAAGEISADVYALWLKDSCNRVE